MKENGEFIRCKSETQDFYMYRDVLTIKYSFTGNGGMINFANIPSSVWVAPQSLMLTIAKWSVAGDANTHVQVNSGSGAFNALATENNVTYVGMLTIMI